MTGLSTLMFSGTEPLDIMSFLTQYTNKCLYLGLSKSEAYIFHRSFLRPPLLDLYNGAKANMRDSDSIYNCPSEFIFLLRAYSTDGNVERGMHELNHLAQLPAEEEEVFALRLQRVHAKFGNYLSRTQFIQRFIGSLNGTIRPAIQCYRQNNRRAPFFKILEEAKTEGRKYRARFTIDTSRTGIRSITQN